MDTKPLGRLVVGGWWMMNGPLGVSKQNMVDWDYSANDWDGLEKPY